MGSERLQRRFWDRIYDRLAPLYDAVDWLTGYTTHRFRRRALPYLPAQGRVLEVGFGGGYLLGLMSTVVTVGFLAGVDRSPAMVALSVMLKSKLRFNMPITTPKMYWHLPTPSIPRMAVHTWKGCGHH